MLDVNKVEELLLNLLAIRELRLDYSLIYHIFAILLYFEILGSTGFDSKTNLIICKSSVENNLVNLFFNF